MPRLSQWVLRAALLYLLLGISIGALLLAHKGVPFYDGLWNWLPAHIEFLLWGWVVQVTMGMAFWILPRYWQQPRRPRTWAAQAAFLALNLGIWLVVGATLLGAGRGVLLAGRLAEIAAVGFFALHAWNRVVSREGA